MLVRTAGNGEQSHVVLVVTGEKVPELRGVEQAFLKEIQINFLSYQNKK